MREAEPVIARRLIRAIDADGYILGYAIYDSTPRSRHTHASCS